MIEYLYEQIIRRSHPRFFNVLDGSVFSRASIELYDDIFAYTQFANQNLFKKIQKNRIQKLIKISINNVPFYAERLKNIFSSDNFNELIPLTRTDLRRGIESGSIFNKKLISLGLKQYTSGTAGIPLSILVDPNMLIRRRALYRRMLRTAGLNKSITLLRVIDREFLGLEGEGEKFFCRDQEDFLRNKDLFFKKCRERKIILHAIPSILLVIAQQIEKTNPTVDFEAIISHAEHLHSETRKYLEKIFNAPVFDYYASREVISIGNECEIHEGIHINSEFVFIEILDKTDNPAPPDKIGDIAITSLDNEIMPLLRYKIGDRGKWLNGQCACGRTLPRIILEGRDIYSFKLPSGKIGHFFQLTKPLAGLYNKILQFQFTKDSDLHFTLRIVPLSSLIESEKKYIANYIKKYLGGGAELKIELVKSIETTSSGKQKSFIDKTNQKGDGENFSGEIRNSNFS